MGMYTELNYNTALKADTPKEVLGILRYMLDNNGPLPDIPEHELFKTARWKFMLRSDSYCFDADARSTLREDTQGYYYLCIQCNLKNYDNEIEKFCDWIRPYIYKDKGQFLGYTRYEETETPTLIYA